MLKTVLNKNQHEYLPKFIEQRICIKFYVENESSYVNLIKILQKAFEDECLSKT